MNFLSRRVWPGAHQVQARGDSLAPHDIDLYFYDESCNLLGTAASAADESATIPSGGRFVLSQLWLGAAVNALLNGVPVELAPA